MSETVAVDLVAWLTQIWDEEEAGIREALRTTEWGVTEFDLARIAADRKILELVTEANELDAAVTREFATEDRNLSEAPYLGDRIVRLLASPYKGREGWQEGWGHE